MKNKCSIRIYDDMHHKYVDKTQLTYRSDVNTIVNSLKKYDLPEGTRVGICLPNSYEFIIWDNALVLSGLVSVIFPGVFLDYDKAQLIAKYELALLISTEPSNLEEGILNYRDNVQTTIVPRDGRIERSDVHSLVFSSGSSGRLKGLVISKNGFIAQSKMVADMYQLDDKDCMMNFLPMANNQQRLLINACISRGCGIVFLPVTNAIASCDKVNPSFIVAPPTFYETVHKLTTTSIDLSDIGENKLTNILGNKLRFCITGMAPILPNILEELRRKGIDLYEVYGQAEIGLICANTKNNNRIGTVGKKVHDIEVEIAYDSEVIVTASTPVTLDYFESSQEDRESTFIENGVIATGDLGYIDADGYLRLIGRKKDALVFRNGEKIHPSEIETKFQNKPYIDMACAYISDKGVLRLALVVARYDEHIHEYVQQYVNDTNKEYEIKKRIDGYTILVGVPTCENGLLTENLKPKRNGIIKCAEQSNSEICYLGK